MSPRQASFPRRIPPVLLRRIDKADPTDPLARQFEPQPDEALRTPEDLDDPIGDQSHAPVPGVVRRHVDRALLMPTLACPVHCRFCFRRDRVGAGALTPSDLKRALAYLRNEPDLREIILSGGDPLMLPPRRLGALMAEIAGWPNIEILRIHSRVPIARPERIDRAMLKALGIAKPVFLVLHCNHANELGPEARQAIRRLAKIGVALLSQTVLLKGVNDRIENLAALMRALLAAGVKPYYLHHPDRAPGTAHFRPSLAEGVALVRALRDQLSGLAQPLYILDNPKGLGKRPVPAWTRADLEGLF
ncbi:MAG: KamA family radical SAM protein [Rhodospirillales bacterium]|nr:KamA family radical SAM protein [Rhodospirillales bacterium]